MVKNKIDDEIDKKDGKFSLKEKILKYLIENKEKPKTIREISGALIVDYKNTFQAINGLLGLIYKEKIGTNNLVEIKLKPSQEIYSIENKRTKEFLEKNKSLKLIQNDIIKINYPFFIVLIFGSYAKKENTKNSDIDICIISDNQEKTKELVSKLGILSLPLEIQEFNIKEFESMLDKKENNLAKEIIKNNIILFGIENYYNLISKWTNKE